MPGKFDKTFYPYFGHLTAHQQSIYRLLIPAIENALPECALNVTGTSQDAFAAIEAIYYDHPEYFWLTTKTTSHYLGSTLTKVELNYNSLVKTRAKAQKELDKAISQYLSGLAFKTLQEKERIIHDRLVRNVDYRSHALDQTAYAALVSKKAVCAGYSRAFQLLMQQIGIPCYYCFGSAANTKTRHWERHAWNILKLGQSYYVMDLTWDDAYGDSNPNLISYTYYNCNDTDIATNHRRDAQCSFLPAAIGTTYRFQKINNGTSAELEVIYQEGVTHKTPVTTKAEFVKLVRPYAKTRKKGTIVISFPVKGKALSDLLLTYLKEVLQEPDSYPGSSHFQNSSTDYHNGWLRCELTIQFK